MNSISYADAMFCYMLLFLCFLAVLWMRFNSRAKRMARRNFSSRLFFCDHCRRQFLLEEEDVNLSRCPRCNAVCIRPRRRDLE